jgi:hypothetical protein
VRLPRGQPPDDRRRVAALSLAHGGDALLCVDAEGRPAGRVTRDAVAARLSLTSPRAGTTGATARAAAASPPAGAAVP